jgi:hypothetical protein
VTRGLAAAALVVTVACGPIAAPPAAPPRAATAPEPAPASGSMLAALSAFDLGRLLDDSVGHRRKKRAPEPDTSILSVALVVGGWRGVDDDKWSYDLDIAADGNFSQVVHQFDEHDVFARDAGTSCVQTGSLAVSAKSAELVRTFDDDECNHDYDHKTVHDAVIRLDDTHLEVKTESSTPVRYVRTR